MLSSGAVCFGFAFIHIYLHLFGRKPNVEIGIACTFQIILNSLEEIPAQSNTCFLLH